MHSNFVFLSSRDVEKNTLVIFNRLFDGHEFLRANEHLLISNILNRKTETKAVSTLFLIDFYKEPMLSTLKIKFFNREWILRDKLHQINKAIDLSAFFANEAKDLEALFNQTGLLTKNKYNIVSHIYLNNTITKNLSQDNQIISRQSRFIREVKEPMASGVERSRGVIQTLAGGIIHCFFFDKKKPALSFHVNQLACFPNLKNCSSAEKPKQCFKSTQLSTKLINVSLRWTTQLIELGTGALSGSVGAIFDKLMDVYPHREMSLTIMSTVLDSLIVSARYFSPALVNHEIESEGSCSLFVVYFANLFIINSLRKILLSLEYSDKPICEQIKNGIQVLYKIFFLYVMFNFFTSEEDCIHKLTILSNLVCYNGASMVSRQLTHAVLNSDFFKTNSREHQEDQVENSEVTKLSGIFQAL